MARSSCTYSSGISPVRSIMSESIRCRNAVSLSKNGRARASSSGSSAGCGWIRSRRNRPRKSSRTKLGPDHSLSRADSAMSRASFSVASAGDLSAMIGLVEKLSMKPRLSAFYTVLRRAVQSGVSAARIGRSPGGSRAIECILQARALAHSVRLRTATTVPPMRAMAAKANH